MEPCPYIQITDTHRRPPAWEPRAATLCALREHHGGLHLMQSGREMRKANELPWVPYTATKEHFDGSDAWIDSVGRSVAYFLCEAKEWSDERLEEARRYQDEGLSQRATVKRLRGVDNGDKFETCVCQCGNTHRRRA